MATSINHICIYNRINSSRVLEFSMYNHLKVLLLVYLSYIDIENVDLNNITYMILNITFDIA